MTNRDAALLYAFALKQKNNNQLSNSFDFKYFIVKTLTLLKTEIEVLGELEKEVEDIIKPYSDKRLEIFKEYGTLSEDGSVYNLKEETLEEAKKLLGELQETYKESLDSYVEKKNEFDKIMEKEVDVFFPVIKDNSAFPPDLTLDEIDLLLRLNVIN